MILGQHLIAGKWVSVGEKFQSSPAFGTSHSFSMGSPELVHQAVVSAEDAFSSYSSMPRSQRARFLRGIANEIDKRGEEITKIGSQETGLPEGRLQGERGRTVGQLNLFADHIENENYLDLRHDPALPDRHPMPRPDLRLVQRSVGPVAVFGASNFPLAFSVAGGDTASALAAGCPVVVKGHSAHPGTSEIVAQAILAAIENCAIHPGVFSLIQGGSRKVGEALVQHTLIAAVGFTGSLTGGRALFNLCAQRKMPIPFFGELGSVNPMFLLPGALSARAKSIGTGWAKSLAMGAGQFCTNPSIAVLVDTPDTEQFIDGTVSELELVPAQTMLSDSIATSFQSGAKRIGANEKVENLYGNVCNDRTVTPVLMAVSGDEWMSNPSLQEEVFGPLGIVIRAASIEQMIQIAQQLEGQLTCTLQADRKDNDLFNLLLPILERKAGRLIANGYPTGVEVCDSMVHGGPYPASTNFGATSVGTMAIRRFLRPVCYQDIPLELLGEI